MKKAQDSTCKIKLGFLKPFFTQIEEDFLVQSQYSVQALHVFKLSVVMK